MFCQLYLLKYLSSQFFLFEIKTTFYQPNECDVGVIFPRLGRYAVESYLEQILSHGFFHADPVSTADGSALTNIALGWSYEAFLFRKIVSLDFWLPIHC